MHQTVNTTSSVQPCCHVTPSKKLKQEWRELKFTDGLETDVHKKAREEILQGKFLEICKVCRVREENGIPSHRTRAVDRFGTEHAVGVKFLDIKFSNTCNLGCRMCKPSDSSILSDIYSKAKQHPNFLDGWIPNKQSFKEEEKVKYTKKLIREGLEILKVTGGEPLACKYFLEIINWCIKNDYAKNLEINFTTNNTKINQSFINKLLKFRKVKIALSIDGTGSIYNYIRYKSDWNTVKQNTIILSKYKDVFTLEIACILQFYNILDIKNLLDFSIEVGIPLHINENIKPTGTELHCLNINQEIKDEFNLMTTAIIKEYSNYLTDDLSTRGLLKDTIAKLKYLQSCDLIQKRQELLRTVKIQDNLYNTNYKDFLYTSQIKFLENLEKEAI
jgi:molybdenum cofactor biosynthesis enzyme MoaA